MNSNKKIITLETADFISNVYLLISETVIIITDNMILQCYPR